MKAKIVKKTEKFNVMLGMHFLKLYILYNKLGFSIFLNFKTVLDQITNISQIGPMYCFHLCMMLACMSL